MSKKSFLSDLLFIFYGIYKNSFFGGLLTALSLPKSAWFSLRFTWIQLTVFTLLENLVDHWLESIWKVRNPYNLTRKKNTVTKILEEFPETELDVCMFGYKGFQKGNEFWVMNAGAKWVQNSKKFAKTCCISRFIYSRLDNGADPVHNLHLEFGYFPCDPRGNEIINNYWTRLSKISWFACGEQTNNWSARHRQITIFCDNRVQ